MNILYEFYAPIHIYSIFIYSGKLFVFYTIVCQVFQIKILKEVYLRMMGIVLCLFHIFY